MNDNIQIEQTGSVTVDSNVDENMSLFIYGNIKIRDVQTDEILVNQRF